MLGRYYPVRSKVHAMNPISKILCIVLFIVMAFLSTIWQLNVLLLILTFLFLMLTNISIIYYLRTMKILFPLYFVVFIIGMVFQVSILDSVFLMMKVTLIVFYFIMLTLTTPITEIIYGLEKLLIFLRPFQLNVSAIALSITEAIRFVPNLIDEGSRILKSAASRGIDYRHSNFFVKLKILQSMASCIFQLTMKKSENLKFAMRLRLYQCGNRTNFRMNHWKIFDSYMVMLYLLILIMIVKKEIMG
ncbi:MAG: energy-coupling factor transporter transmembrane protein EcfT [Bacilli bacterium]|nr:energy-coupling factor transporter transmembrane protein EcfT [Bacilli bacterium]